MTNLKTEYEVEKFFINQLQTQGYSLISMTMFLQISENSSAKSMPRIW